MAETPDKLAALAPMLGEWSVRGTVHGEPVSGTASARPVLGGAWIEYAEVIDGYEDLCLYGVGEEGDLVVHHFTSEGHAASHTVLPRDGGGLHWVPAKGMGAFVRLIWEDEGFRTEVGRFEADELDVVLTFRPA